MVVFKPFADEILLGKVSKSSRDGVKCEFFRFVFRLRSG